MNKGWLLAASLAFSLAANTRAATQTIEVESGANLIAVELKVGENRLTDLFPEASVGTIIYTFDNSAGWRAAQMYPFGWSHPGQKILPWEGAVLITPTNPPMTITLTGEAVPFPAPDYVVPNGPLKTAQFYRGFNLVSARLAKYIGEARNEASNIYLYNRNLMKFAVVSYDGLGTAWFPTAPPNEGAVWYETSEAPVHPNRTFTNQNTAVYFNNYAPAYGVDRPFLDTNCQPNISGSAILVNQRGHGRAYGPAVPFSNKLPGYFDPTAHLVRYVPPDFRYYISDISVFGPLSGFFTVPASGHIPPMWPTSIEISPTISFSGEPADIIFRPGTNAEIRVTLSHPGIQFGELLLQWQKRNSAGAWTDVLNDTSTVILFENVRASDAGAYRLRARYRCKEFHSRTANLTLLAPILTCEPRPVGKMRLRVNFPVPTPAKIQASTNLKTWEDTTDIIAPASEWSTEVTVNDGMRFYRVIEVP